MDWHPQQHVTTPFFAPQGLSLHPNTPFHSNHPLPLAHQTQSLFHPQQQLPARHQPGPQYGGPAGPPPQMHHMYNQHLQQFPGMPPWQYAPIHLSGSGIHSSVPQPAVIPIQKVREKSWGRSKSKVVIPPSTYSIYTYTFVYSGSLRHPWHSSMGQRSRFSGYYRPHQNIWERFEQDPAPPIISARLPRLPDLQHD